MRLDFCIAFEVEGEYALFSEPITRVGGEKYSYPIPTYEAVKGICESIYWKPTFQWVVDKVRVLNPIKSEAKGIKTLSYSKPVHSLSYYTYLKKVRYQVQAHIEWNTAREDLASDRIMRKHYDMAIRSIKNGGRRDIFLGTRECQAYIHPTEFGAGEGAYDNSGTVCYGLLYHSITYPNQSDNKEMRINMWTARMENGVINYPRPENCDVPPKRFSL